MNSQKWETAHGGGAEPCRPAERTPRHYILDFSRSKSSVYTDVLNLGILLLDNFAKKKKNKDSSQVFKICFLGHCVFTSGTLCLQFFTFIRTRGIVAS